ncbi:hypothetical protein EVAR_3399_1 [Eumeta japonica]|uniref:Uncharacterized protein n=1 Tax=Eumeta variegata TaxID=151549 RepID=A0A4C1SUN5_EUMVA|nr:hypothetical protein EVAR_3399_1 [Eumeta japonica]
MLETIEARTILASSAGTHKHVHLQRSVDESGEPAVVLHKEETKIIGNTVYLYPISFTRRLHPIDVYVGLILLSFFRFIEFQITALPKESSLQEFTKRDSTRGGISNCAYRSTRNRFIGIRTSQERADRPPGRCFWPAIAAFMVPGDETRGRARPRGRGLRRSGQMV